MNWFNAFFGSATSTGEHSSPPLTVDMVIETMNQLYLQMEQDHIDARDKADGVIDVDDYTIAGQKLLPAPPKDETE